MSRTLVGTPDRLHFGARIDYSESFHEHVLRVWTPWGFGRVGGRLRKYHMFSGGISWQWNKERR